MTRVRSYQTCAPKHRLWFTPRWAQLRWASFTTCRLRYLFLVFAWSIKFTVPLSLLSTIEASVWQFKEHHEVEGAETSFPKVLEIVGKRMCLDFGFGIVCRFHTCQRTTRMPVHFFRHLADPFLKRSRCGTKQIVNVSLKCCSFQNGCSFIAARNCSSLTSKLPSAAGFNDYSRLKTTFELKVPPDYNFASHVIDKWAEKLQVSCCA